MMHESLSSPVVVTPHLSNLVPPPAAPLPSVARRLDVYVRQAHRTREQRNQARPNAHDSEN